MQKLLFVYGSLMTALDHPMGQKLRSEAELIGGASVAGRLYRASWYPGLKPARGEGERVLGELYRLADPARSLLWLDEYEGITHGGLSVSEADEYARVEIDTRTADGRAQRAWVYLYQRPLPEAARIVEGIWRG